MKKFLVIILNVLLISNLIFSSNISFADDFDEDDASVNEISENIINEDIANSEINSTNGEQNATNNKINNTNSRLVNAEDKKKEPSLNSTRYVVFDRLSKTCIYGKNENIESAMASTTKIMTAIIVLENCRNLEDVVTIGEKSANTGGSRLGLKKDDKISVNDLLYGLLMRSGNDAAVALANYVSGSVESFADLMNSKALSLGLTHTHFVTPHGLDNPNHYTTPFELAFLTDYALQNSVFATIVKTKFATIKINNSPKELKNTNELLLGNIDGVYGVKTGFTGNAGRCLVTAVKRNNLDLIIVVLGADTRKDRAKDTLKLIDYCTSEFKIKDVDEFAQNEYQMWKNVNEKRIVINKGSTTLSTKLGDIKIKQIATNKELSSEIHSINYLNAPVSKGSKVGELVIKNGDEIIENIDIVVSQTIEKNNVLDYFKMFANCIAS